MLTTKFYFFFFNDTATTEIYTLSLHDALPISDGEVLAAGGQHVLIEKDVLRLRSRRAADVLLDQRSEEHTSELQSLAYLVCRLLLEKKKKQEYNIAKLRCIISTDAVIEDLQNI